MITSVCLRCKKIVTLKIDEIFNLILIGIFKIELAFSIDRYRVILKIKIFMLISDKNIVFISLMLECQNHLKWSSMCCTIRTIV